MARTVSIRRSLLVNGVALVVVLGAAVLATTVLGARRTVRELSGALIRSALDETDARLEAFFEPVQRGLRLTRSWGEAGLLDLEAPERVDALLGSLIGSAPHVASALVTGEGGREQMLRRSDGEWQRRQTWVAAWGHETRWLTWRDSDPTRHASVRELAYDPRERPWYAGGLAAGDGAHWTEPYTFFTSGTPGITVSTSFHDPQGHVHVVALDVELSEISRFTGGLRVTPGARALVTDADGRLLGLPAGAPPEALLRPVAEAGLPLVRDALARGAGRESGGEPRRFESGGEAWWGHVRAFPLAPGRELVLAVMVPERDLLGHLRERRAVIAGVSALAVLLAVLRAMAMARRYARPIEQLVGESDRISHGDLEPGPPVASGVAEMGLLAAAHERMRVALRSLLRLERDLQVARQIQQNTFPAEMPVVPGYEVDAWSEPADETGGDSYDVVGLRGREGRVSSDRAERVVLLLADATGHGIGPALSVAEVRAMLRMGVRARRGIGEIARHVNEQLCADLRSGRFVTAWLGELDARAHELRSLSAGQAPILHWEEATGRCHELPADAAPLGILPDLAAGDPVPIALGPGDLVAVLSDGIFEAAGPDGELFGVARVVACLRERRLERPGQILAALRDELGVFTCGRAAADDRTAIVVKRTAR